jgi:hypothetical protein
LLGGTTIGAELGATVPLGTVAFGLIVPFGSTALGASTPFVLVPLGTVVPFGVTTVPFEPTPVGETPLGETPVGAMPPVLGVTPFGTTVIVPESRLFEPGVVTVLAPALFGMTVALLLMPVPLFICRACTRQLGRSGGSRLWQLVPGGKFWAAAVPAATIAQSAQAAPNTAPRVRAFISDLLHDQKRRTRNEADRARECLTQSTSARKSGSGL